MRTEIFTYHSDRAIDPFRAERLLSAYLGGDPRAAWEKTKSPFPEVSIPATDAMLAALSQTFGVPLFNPSTCPTGATEDVLFTLLDDFMAFREKKNQTAASSPTLPASSASTPPASAPASSSTTTPTTDCGCS